MVSYDPNDKHMLFLFIATALGVLSSFYVITKLIQFGTMKSSFTFLLFFLEISLIGEQITALPFVFTGNSSFCTFIAYLASYFGMMNVVLVTLLITAHRLTLFNNTLRFRRRIVRYGREISLIFPLLTTLIPFATQIYQHHRKPWCLAKPHEDEVWMFVAFYGWVGLLLLLSLINTVALSIRVCVVAPDMAGRFFSSVGMCSFVSIAAWIPRFIFLVTGRSDMVGVVAPIYLQSILLAIIFICDLKSLESNERHYSVNAPINFRASNHSSFSWEVGELLEELASAGLLHLHTEGNSGESTDTRKIDGSAQLETNGTSHLDEEIGEVHSHNTTNSSNPGTPISISTVSSSSSSTKSIQSFMPSARPLPPTPPSLSSEIVITENILHSNHNSK